MTSAANTLSVTVGDSVYEVIFAGFGADLLVLSPDGEPLAWRPWTLIEHLRALGLCLRAAVLASAAARRAPRPPWSGASPGEPGVA